MQQIDRPNKAERQTLAKYTAALILADAAHSLLMDFERESLNLGKGIKQSYKQKFSDFRKSAIVFRLRLKDTARDGYKIAGVNDFCEQSDELEEAVRDLIKVWIANGENNETED